MGDYYKIEVTNNEAHDLTGYQVQLDAASLGITSDTESWKFYIHSDEITTSVTGDSYTTNESETFTLTPTNPISSLAFTTTDANTSYSYDFDVKWTQDAYRYAETTNNGYANLDINFTPSESITSGTITGSYNTIDLTAQDYIGTISSTLDGASISSTLTGNEVSTDVTDLDTSEHFLNHSIAINNNPTVTVENMNGVIDEANTFTADFYDPDGLGADSYMWDFGNGDTSPEPEPIYTYSNTGTYECSVEVTEQATVSPQTVTDSFTVIVTESADQPILTEQSPSSNVTTVTDEEVVFSATVDQNANNKWTLDGVVQEWDNSSSTPSFTYTSDSLGQHDVVLTSYNTIDDSLTSGLSWDVEVSGTHSKHLTDIFHDGMDPWSFLTGIKNIFSDNTNENLFWGIILSIPFIGMYTRQNGVIVVSTIYLFSGIILMPVLPAPLAPAAFWMLMLSVIGVIYKAFRG